MGNARNFAFWIVLFLLILALFNLFSNSQSRMAVAERELFRIHRRGGQRRGEPGDRSTARTCATSASDGKTYATVVPGDAAVTDTLIDNGVAVKAETQEQSGFRRDPDACCCRCCC